MSFYQRRLVCCGLESYCHFVAYTNAEDTALMMGFFDRSATKVRGIAANIEKGKQVKVGWKTINTHSEDGWTGMFRPESVGRDRFLYCVASNRNIGKRFLITTAEALHGDLYDFLMNNYKLPLLPEWMPAILEALKKRRYTYQLALTFESSGEVNIKLGGKNVELRQITCWDFANLTNDLLTEVVCKMLADKVICISKKTMNPLKFDGMDDYLMQYGSSMADNLSARMNPLSPLKPNVDTLALKHMSLFPQQAACVNGMLAMKNHGLKYAVMNQGMGVGKTIQALSVVESAAVEEWLRKNPGKTLKDAYAPDVIKYRVVIMPPGHLVEKWEQSILDEIPYATVYKCRGLTEWIALRERGKEPAGREFYIVSKDNAKLDTLLAPIPTNVKWGRFSLGICKTCLEEDGKVVYKKGHGSNAICPACKGNDFKPAPVTNKKNKGLICPSCGELLIKDKGYDINHPDFYENIDSNVLTPLAFAGKKQENSTCYHCGAALWGVNAKPLMMFPGAVHKSKWSKVTHFANHTHKSTSTAYVLSGYEDVYKASVVTTEGWKEQGENIYGPRKSSPAKFIKKYLKGYFDFCILDEAHKYLGDSAQGVAAHSLVKASKFTLALTGTISNGTAEAFYNLFWMLEPNRMIEEGFKYCKADKTRFCKEYGCVETIYEVGERKGNIMSRGKQLGSPKVKPGISPVIFGKFLMDRCLFLDISDLSKYLPDFIESIKLCPLPEEIEGDYKRVIETLKEDSQTGKGMGVLSTMLQYGLSFPDKPYDRGPIKDPYTKDAILVRPENFEQYSSLENLTPKEKLFIKTIKAEIEEGRNCFVYATYTSSAEANVTWRLKDLVEHYCNLHGRVEIIQSTSPTASKREEWFHKRASEGIKVFITNPMNVETGLDFCFKYKGVEYNFPTLMFYQTGYQLATIWQASRRAYRLNQKQECRNYYFAYEGTLQEAALEIMAKKQTATAAIQGHFSAEGLSAMAKGVDAKAQLAASLSRNDKDATSRESLENMFDALSIRHTDEDRYGGFVRNLTFFELMEIKEGAEEASLLSVFMEESEPVEEFADLFGAEVGATVVEEINVISETSATTEEVMTDSAFFLNNLFGCFEDFGTVENTAPVVDVKKKALKKKSNTMEGSVSLFALFDAV